MIILKVYGNYHLKRRGIQYFCEKWRDIIKFRHGDQVVVGKTRYIFLCGENPDILRGFSFDLAFIGKDVPNSTREYLQSRGRVNDFIY